MVTGAGDTGVGVFAGAVVVTVADGLGEADTMAVGDAVAVGVAVAVGAAVTVGVALAVTGADVLGVAVTGMDVLGEAEGADDEVDGDVVGCPVAVPTVCPEPLVSAMPVKVHPASSPTDIDTTASGRHARRRA